MNPRFSVAKYKEEDRNSWNTLVDSSFNGTFMHRREFLDYHGDRFEDHSLLIYKNYDLCAVFPAVLDNRVLVSHPGTTVAGLVYDDSVRGNDLKSILERIKQYHKFQRIIYKNTPIEFQRHAVQDDIWALHTLRAKKISCELSSILNPLMTNYVYWPDRKEELSCMTDNILLSAMNLGDLDFLEEFWESVLVPNLSKYGIEPIHTPKDINYLYNKFPVFVKGLLATHKSGKMLGGLIIFRFNKCYHVQYSVANAKGRALHTMSLLHHYMIENLPTDVHYYNFGKSTECHGYNLNDALYYYKNGFGGGSMTYDTYEY